MLFKGIPQDRGLHLPSCFSSFARYGPAMMNKTVMFMSVSCCSPDLSFIGGINLEHLGHLGDTRGQFRSDLGFIVFVGPLPWERFAVSARPRDRHLTRGFLIIQHSKAHVLSKYENRFCFAPVQRKGSVHRNQMWFGEQVFLIQFV